MSPLTQYLTDEEIVKAWVNKSDRPRKLIEIAKQARAAGFREGVEKAATLAEQMSDNTFEIMKAEFGTGELKPQDLPGYHIAREIRSLRDDEG